MPARPAAELPASSWEANQSYQILFEPLSARVRVDCGGETIGETDNARVMYELGHAPVYYLPQSDVRMGLLTPTEHSSHCPYKGDARYWSVNAGGKSLENAIWAYDDPYEEMNMIRGWMGFYWDRFSWFENGEALDAPREIEGRVNQSNNFAAAYPDLAADWHPDKNERIRPYEFSPDSEVRVWWKSVDNDEWQESIKTRVERHRRAGKLSAETG